jgi:hypothetical protein
METIHSLRFELRDGAVQDAPQQAITIERSMGMAVRATRRRTREIRGATIAMVVVVGIALWPANLGARGSTAVRLLTTGLEGRSLFESTGGPGGRLSSPAPPIPAPAVTSTTVDATPWAGYENAIHAANEDVVFVAYKRFTEDPGGGGYVPAELRVARSIDGGATWKIRVVDQGAIEQADTIDGSVSIDGDRGATVYVAYHVRASGLFADMELRVAKSTDGGATWSTQTVADANAGDHNSIRVLDENTVLISAHAQGPDEGVHVYVTRDGGGTWMDSLVEGGLGNGFYTSVGANSLRTVLVAWYNSLYPDHTDLNAGRRAGGAWETMTVDGTPGDNDLTGLGASAWVAPGPAAWIAYEADTSQGAFVKVARLAPGLPGWTIVPVQQGPSIGWNTAIHSVGMTDVYVSYWLVDGTGKGMPMLAVSSDGGVSWSPVTIPDPRHAQPYLDSTAPSVAVQYESYQTTDEFGERPVLRVARVDLAS